MGFKLSDKETSGTTRLKIIGNELWSCEGTGVMVFDLELNFLRAIKQSKLGSVLSAALLDESSVIVATLSGLTKISKNG